LTILDSIIALGKNPLTLKPLASMIPQVKLSESSSITWSDFISYSEGLKNSLIDQIYSNYHFKQETKKEAFTAFDDLTGAIMSQDYLLTDFFTLNYDRLLEEYLIFRNIEYIDGFTSIHRRNLWSPETFKRDEDRVDSSTPVRLFKLHGSLNWREYEGTIESVTTEEPSRNLYHKKNIFIYPTQVCDDTSEPYSSMYPYFRSAKEYTNVLIVIGYSFRDEPINQIIVEYVKHGKVCIMISPTISEDVQNIGSLISKTKSKNYLISIPSTFSDTNLNRTIQEVLNRHM
jgi:hypothetical protein